MNLSFILRRLTVGTLLLCSLFFNSFGQTNVFSDIIAVSPNHTYLKAALEQQGLDVALQNGSATLTVFAPTNTAFEDLATKLNTDISGLLALPTLTDVLTYHVLGSTVQSAAVTNGAIVNPLSPSNSLKLTKTTGGSVYVNQAQVTTADLTADNGVVHVIDAVLLPSETVVDIAIGNNFTYLTAAVIKAELLPALTDPFATFTVFAPTDAAFTNLATLLNTDVNGLLALPQLADILTYHVLGTEVTSSSILNGTIASPLGGGNTLKITKKTNGTVFINHAQVTTADVMSDNGVVHVINEVLLPSETVVDVAIDNNFSTLTAALVKAELIPTLSDPFSEFTVFAPTNNAFTALATALGTDLNGLLASPALNSILLYHVVSGAVFSDELTNGQVLTLNNESITVDVTNGVKINNANVTTADIEVDNGVVHVIDAVLLPASLSIQNSNTTTAIRLYPNPTQNMLVVENIQNGNVEVLDNTGRVVLSGALLNGILDVSSLKSGMYYLRINSNEGLFQNSFIRQ